MSFASIAVEKRTFTTFATAILVAGGALSYFGLGQLEDPEFTVKTAVVMTSYPGASPKEVELEVTDRIELALQELPQLKDLDSFSRAGLSIITVDIKPAVASEELGQVWDELRKKVRDIEATLPLGAGTPSVSDDFGDVYGFLLAVVGDGFSYAQLERYVDSIKKELSVVPGVSRVELWGEQSECVYVEASQARLSQLGLTMADVQHTLTQQNVVVDGGGFDVQRSRLRIEMTGEFSSPEEIADLVIRGAPGQTSADAAALTRIGDFATVRRGYVEPAHWEMRHNGQPAMGISISNVSGGNVVDLGAALDKRLAELNALLPVGIETHRISWQSDLVSQSIVDFMISVIEAVVIVLIALWVGMGFRTAVIVGLSGLVFTIVGSMIFMKMFGIDLQRMSLGALIIAMGMMVDNVIVVADGILVRMEQGMDRVKAAIQAATQPSIPLLGATIVGVMAFYPIMASDESAGEYCQSLFTVVAIVLLVSWVLSITAAPIMCIAMLPAAKTSGDQDPYAGRFYGSFRRLLELSLRFRWSVMALLVALLGASLIGFGHVDRMFFPAAARAQFMVDYWAPEGTRFGQTSADVKKLEEHLLADEQIQSVSTFVGQGPPRFYLPVDPESPYESYAQLVVNTESFGQVEGLIAELQPWADQNVPEGRVIVRKYGLGPFETWPVEARFSGPAVADPEVLRDLANQAVEIMEASPHALIVRTNWRERVGKLRLDYDQRNARWTSVSREDVAQATRRAYDGAPVGTFREHDKLLPILLRHTEPERQHLASSFEELQIRPPLLQESVPLSQVTNSIDLEWEDPLIWRWNRRRALTVQGVPQRLATTLRDDVLEKIESIPLPVGYTMEWDGEFRSSGDAQASLIPGMIPAMVTMALIIVGLFNAYRPPLVIVFVTPFAMIGITVGLLVTKQPFGFVALLGGMSLVGMMIKNAVVLLDQINIEKAEGKLPYQAVMDAALSRLRPVLLAAATTVLGVIPLLQDVFWVAMAVTIMFGLAFGTILTMVAVPVIYSILFGLPRQPEAAQE